MSSRGSRSTPLRTAQLAPEPPLLPSPRSRLTSPMLSRRVPRWRALPAARVFLDLRHPTRRAPSAPCSTPNSMIAGCASTGWTRGSRAPSRVPNIEVALRELRGGDGGRLAMQLAREGTSYAWVRRRSQRRGALYEAASNARRWTASGIQDETAYFSRLSAVYFGRLGTPGPRHASRAGSGRVCARPTLLGPRM